MTHYTQDDITYKIDNGVVKGWYGTSPFKKPVYENGVIVEGWTAEDQSLQDEKDAQEALNAIPSLAAIYCDQLGISYGREIDIPIDHIEAFRPTEKVYHLLGYPIYKEYYFNDVCVCRLEYEKLYEERTHLGFSSNEFVGTKTRFVFYKDENRNQFAVKEKITKRFSLVPTVINDELSNPIDVIWSGADREGLMRSQRYKSEQVMKAFNPNLYQLFISIWESLYTTYKETGKNDDLIDSVSNYILPVLDTEVQDDDKLVIFGEMETYPSLTIRQLIIMALP